MSVYDKFKRTGGKIAASLFGSALLVLFMSAQSYAQSSVKLSVVSGHVMSGGKFSIVAKDTPGTKLELYVNGKNPTKATVNKKDQATFNRVKLSGTGKLSFTKIVSGKAQSLSYTRRYTVKNGKVSFSSYITTTKSSSSATTRKVQGTAVTLGAGTFTGGKDVAVGLYNVTTASGQSGNFIVTGKDSYDEVLGVSDGLGVPEVRAKISKGDQIQLSGLSSVVFTPVTTPYVTTHSTINLYAGTWIVGQDIGAGRYVATTTAGSSGNFIVTGYDEVDEILGQSDGEGVPSVTTTLHKGDTIQISGLSQVTMTAKD